MAAKRKGKKSKSQDSKLMGTYEEPKIGTCILCGGSIFKKLDKRRRLYIRCYQCSTIMFLGSYFAEIGYKIIENLIDRDVLAFQDEIKKYVYNMRSDKTKIEKEKIAEKEMKEFDKTLGLKVEV